MLRCFALLVLWINGALVATSHNDFLENQTFITSCMQIQIMFEIYQGKIFQSFRIYTAQHGNILFSNMARHSMVIPMLHFLDVAKSGSDNCSLVVGNPIRTLTVLISLMCRCDEPQILSSCHSDHASTNVVGLSNISAAVTAFGLPHVHPFVGDSAPNFDIQHRSQTLTHPLHRVPKLPRSQ